MIVELDGRNGSIGDATSFLLYSDGSFYSCVCPGRDCDLVIFGAQGILGYDLGSASIKWDENDPTNMWVVAEGTKFHYVPAAQQ